MREPQPLRGAGSQCWHVAVRRMSGRLLLPRCLPSKISNVAACALLHQRWVAVACKLTLPPLLRPAEHV